MTSELDDYKITKHQLRILISIKLLLKRNQETSGRAVSELVKSTPQQARGLMHLLELRKVIKAHKKMGPSSNAWNFTITPLGESILREHIK